MRVISLSCCLVLALIVPTATKAAGPKCCDDNAQAIAKLQQALEADEATIKQLQAGLAALVQQIGNVNQSQIRITTAVLNTSSATSIQMAKGTILAVITEIPGGQTPISSGSIVVARDVVESNAARFPGTGASFWCDGDAIRASGTIGSSYRVIFVSQS